MMKLIQFFIFCTILICSSTIGAQEVEVVVEPKEAIINESFFVTFKIQTTDSEEPYISFTPYGASVLGKRSQGLSISTTVINGKFSTKKEQAIVYELSADRVGQAYLRNINVEIGTKKIPVKEVRISVLSEPKRLPEAFIEAEASKTKVFLGEGLDVNYYLYFKNTIIANDVKEFPKLNKFIKRFHHINSPVETVQYKGQVLKRIHAYSARLYPEKTGTAVLDPMKISVQIAEQDYSSPFGGFGSQRMRNKDLSSSRVEIEVLPLPTEGLPSNFSGLVGEHEFILSVNKNKFLVNEPIEFKFEVRGKGAVENFDAPLFYTHNNLEQFDTKSDVSEIGTQSAKKLFEYTLLARGPLSIPERDLSLSYFDPNSQKYIEKKIKIPKLEVSGVQVANTDPNKNSKEASNANVDNGESELTFNNPLSGLFSSKKLQTVAPQGLIAPKFGKEKTKLNWQLGLNLILGIIAIALGVIAIRSNMSKSTDQHYLFALKAYKELLKEKNVTYSKMFTFLSYLDRKNSMASKGSSIVDVIQGSELTELDKKSVIEMLQRLEKMDFSKETGLRSLNLDKKMMKRILKKI